MEKGIIFETFDLVASPAFSNAIIYSNDVYLKHIQELNRRINRYNRKNKIIDIFGDELF